MALVCFDTPVLIYLFDSPNSNTLSKQQLEERQRLGNTAKGLVKYLYEEGTEIILPTITITEYLTKVPAEFHEHVLNLLLPKFVIAAFDHKTASIAAALRNEKDSLLKEYPSQERECLKADIMIIATAIQYNCKVVYTNDDNMKTFASGHIEVRLLKDLHFGSLFD